MAKPFLKAVNSRFGNGANCARKSRNRANSFRNSKLFSLSFDSSLFLTLYCPLLVFIFNLGPPFFVRLHPILIPCLRSPSRFHTFFPCLASPSWFHIFIAYLRSLSSLSSSPILVPCLHSLSWFPAIVGRLQ